MGNIWTEDKIEFLKSNVDKYTNRELSTLLNVTKSAISTLLGKQNIKRKKNLHYKKGKRNNNGHGKKEIRFIEVFKADYLDTPCYECISHCLGKDNYPIKRVNGKTTHIARFIWEQHNNKNVPKGFVVRHKCDNKLCINIEHLEIGTVKDNVQDRIKRNRSAKGSKSNGAKLTNLQVVEIKKALQNYKCGDIIKLAKKYKVIVQTISDIRNNKTWKQITID